jgi:hypothetical protein
MAYSGTLRLLLGGAIADKLSTGGISAGGANVWQDISSDAATDILGAGYYVGVMAPPSSSPGIITGMLARSTWFVGAKDGDPVMHIESSAGVTPGKLSWHAFKNTTYAGASTANSTAGAGVGFNGTVSSAIGT